MVLWINFLIQVPIAIALGFDKPEPGLMERKPRPLSQPVLSRSQWVRIIALGLIIAIGTLLVEAGYAASGILVASTIAYVTFSLFNIMIGLNAGDEFKSLFNSSILSDRRQLMLYGLAFLFTFLGTELGFLQRFLGTTSLTRDQWLICVAVSLTVVVADELIKFFLRRRHREPEASERPAGVQGLVPAQQSELPK